MKIENIPLNITKNKLVQILLIGFVFFIPISTALMNLFLYSSLFLIVVNKDFIKNTQFSWNNNASKYSAAFFMLIIVGLFYSIAEYQDMLESLSNYKKFLFVILLLPYFVNKKNNEVLINTFLVSMGFVLILVYLINLNIIDPINIKLSGGVYINISEYGGFKTHIITNILFAFSGFLTMHKFFHLNRVVYLIIGLLTFYYSIFINDGTTGQILSISLLSLLIIQRFKRKSYFILPFVALSIFTYGSINTNTSAHSTIKKVQTGINNYSNNIAKGSVDVRMSMIGNGITVAKENPWLGTGTGSINQAHFLYFNELSEEFKSHILINNAGNPHSEYLSILIQLGIFGLFLYLLLIYKLLFETKQLPNSFYRHSAQGLLILVVVASIGTPIITNSGEGHFVMLFIAILFAPLSNRDILKHE
jgi:O-antigen ligase